MAEGAGDSRWRRLGARLEALAEAERDQFPLWLPVGFTAGYLTLELRVTDARTGIDYDHADWGAPTLTCGSAGAGSWVSDRAWASSSNGWGPAERDQSNGEQPATDGSVLTVSGVHYTKGIGAHPAGSVASDVAVTLGGACTRFTAVAGVDAETAGRGSVVFSVVADGTTLFTSPTVTTTPVAVDVDVTGRGTLRLVVAGGPDGVEYDHADWADARLLC